MPSEQSTTQEAREDSIGAVMVVGGGIAGMQASLDLAASGYKVYLVEAKSAIGGHMAQLDKTFPTNDCAMCIISPKLVETGRHPNIGLLTNAEVLSLKGEAGNFTATVRQQPRYVDLDKCTGCGDCVEVCPITLPNPYEEGLTSRKAIYRLYSQAIPSGFAIDKIGVAPCRDACPIGQRAQGYIALVRERRYEEALRLIQKDNPFPSVCGRTCHHPCEGKCNRALIDETVGIMAIKRFVADYTYAYGRKPVERVPRTRPEWIAVVGSGPAGLTAAQDAVKMGYRVTVFEALPVAGGLMRTGIPAHRLPKGILQRDIDDILALGVELKLNTPITDPTQLLADGYDAVFMATGTFKEERLDIEGGDLPVVRPAIDILREVNLGGIVDVGQRVVVIGSGIAAVDAAAVSVRMGAKEVYLFLLRPRGEVPAYEWEIDEVEREGVSLMQGYTVTRILEEEERSGDPSQGKVVKVEYAEAELSRSRQYKPIAGTEAMLEADTVISAVGRSSGLAFLDPSFQSLESDPQTLETDYPGVFTGDSKGFIVNAIALGHKAGSAIDRYLQGEPLAEPERPAVPVAKWSRDEAAERVAQGEIELKPRISPAMLPLDQRVSFQEVVAPFSEQQALAEAARCLQCGDCSECLACVDACGLDAIDHEMVERLEELKVGAVILAPGYQVYQSEMAEEYGWGRYPNVVTSLQFERLLNASGPTTGHVRRPSDGRTPRKIAFLQCVGSRDQSHDYCSAVCCMYATKEAIMAIEHERDIEVHVFMMDMRAFSKGYEAYYHRAQEQYGVRYVRCRVSSVKEDPGTHHLVVRYAQENAPHPIGETDGSGQGMTIAEDIFDLVVLSVGMEIAPEVQDLAGRLGIDLDDYGFCHTAQFQPLQTSKPGIYAVGPFREPKDIPESVTEASGAAALAGSLLSSGRGTLVVPPEYPPEKDINGQEPRIGVFVCHCGSNIGGFLDVPAVAEYARSLPNVVHTEHTLYACSQDSIERITEKTKELALNRVVVASCTPLTHETLFQDSIRQAGLNPFLFEMANIRNQCSWVHSHDHQAATEKAKELVRMSVARAARLEPLHRITVPVTKRALVIGGGVAGIHAALTLAGQDIAVDLVERERELGGNLRHLRYLVETPACTSAQEPCDLVWRDAQAYRKELIAQINAVQNIAVHLETELLETQGYKGSFTSVLRTGDGEVTVQHGVTIVATGAREYRGTEYGYGSHPHILTQQEFEVRLGDSLYGASQEQETGTSVVMIQCVGPAEQYCSRTCCTVALKNALKLKELNPSAQITVLYRDIRTYGFKERLYTEARRAGVLFIRYDADHKPAVCLPDRDGEQRRSADEPLEVRVWEPMLGREIVLRPDTLVLSTPLVPAEGAEDLANRLKVGVDLDGWLMEAHVKLRPVDFSTEGLYMAGSAHYPKLVDEVITQAQAAAGRAATILAQDTLEVGGVVAQVEPEACVGCLTCVRFCPFNVPQMRIDLSGVGGITGAAYIEPAQCQGCGICVAECPAHAIQLMHYRGIQMEAKVEAMFGT
jgi:heterodisulfide reductase subunit A-like polyferredoxin